MNAVRLTLTLVLTAGLAACAEPYPGKQPDAVEAPERVEGSGAKMDLTPEAADLKARLTRMVGAPPDEVRDTPADGVLEARWGSNFAYVMDDGRHVIYGDMINLDTGEEISENSRKLMRLSALNRLGTENMIVFPAKKPRHTITVFTDIDCGYCRKMHREIQDYNDSGITVRYLFYPRSGPGTESFQKAEAVWCSKDRRAALTRAKNGGSVKAGKCSSPVTREWELGQQLGLRGTPMIILGDGEVVNGYVPASALAARFMGDELKAKGLAQ